MYTVYHLHSDLSLLDSCSKFSEYVDLAKAQGMTAIGCSEHGRISNWAANKLLCKQNGLKYLHACEVYLTAQLEHTTIVEPDGSRIKVSDMKRSGEDNTK